MTFDIHRSLMAIKLYGFLLISILVVGVLQPQKLVGRFLAGDGSGDAWNSWTAHVSAGLIENSAAVVIVTALAIFLDIFELRRIGGLGR